METTATARLMFASPVTEAEDFADLCAVDYIAARDAYARHTPTNYLATAANFAAARDAYHAAADAARDAYHAAADAADAEHVARVAARAVQQVGHLPFRCWPCVEGQRQTPPE